MNTGIDNRDLGAAAATAIVAGVLLAIIGAFLVNSAYADVNPFIQGDEPGGQMLFGWLVAGLGGMLVQAGLVAVVFWGAARK